MCNPIQTIFKGHLGFENLKIRFMLCQISHIWNKNLQRDHLMIPSQCFQ